ncbi:MAG TPA: sigma-70 family RNA polymerase sigma factor [Blastocatellia bacterium]|nr:sigma-70 family RNA polymerase sigma factor [Blastocatellia bacterium]
MLANATHLRTVPSPAASAADGAENLELLFKQYHDQIFRAAYRVTGNALDAEDVLQTVFLRLVRRKGELELGPNPGSYLHRAAINAALDLLRARSKSSSVPIEEVLGDLIETREAQPDKAQASREVQRALRKAITKLNANAAEMFVLRYFEGYDNQEIASLLGTSKLVVGVILHRTRARLRKELGVYLEGN